MRRQGVLEPGGVEEVGRGSRRMIVRGGREGEEEGGEGGEGEEVRVVRKRRSSWDSMICAGDQGGVEGEEVASVVEVEKEVILPLEGEGGAPEE